MKKLYAILIGINDYPIAQHRLNGCVEDVEAIYAFFKSYCASNEIDFTNVVLLKNEQATRQNIITAFEVFKGVDKDDICLLYYSGHGSSQVAPKEFHRDEISGKLETLVCYNSRMTNGKDLTDKELSYLFWKNTHKTEPHFLTIFDCCHSGAITRNAEVRQRMAEDNPNKAFFEELEGYQQFKEQDGYLIPPVAKHITLSACREYQSSVEMRIQGKPRGLFTWSLLETLKNSTLNHLSYEELMRLIYAKIQNKYAAQHPQLDAYNGFNSKQLFLNGALKLKSRDFITYDNKKGWLLPLGTIHGMRSGVTLFCKTSEGTQTTTIEAVYPSVSYLTTKPWMEREKRYEIESFSTFKPSMKISLEKLSNKKVKNLIVSLVEEEGLAIEWTKNASYSIQFRNGKLVLVSEGKDTPVFQPISVGKLPNNKPANISFFLDNVMRVYHWNYVSELSNPMAKTPLQNEVEITFSEVLEHEDYKTIVKSKEKDINSINDFHYREQFGELQSPCLTLSIKNKGARKLWIGALYLSHEDFGISASCLPLLEVQPGDAPYHMFFEYNDYRHPMIPLRIPEVLSEQGITSVRNQIKIFVSTEEFNLRNFEQAGLQVEGQARRFGKRGAGFGTKKSPSKIRDWAIVDLNFNIVKPTLVGVV